LVGGRIESYFAFFILGASTTTILLAMVALQTPIIQAQRTSDMSKPLDG
jgi:hypothetical protein